MQTELPEGWTAKRLGDIATRVRRRVGDDPGHILMITSTRGFVPQSEKYSRFMAGESLKNYTELRRGEFAYNKGNSSTYPQGCVFRLDAWETAAVPSVYISFRLTEKQVHSGFLAHYFAAGALNSQLKRVITSSARSNGLLNISVHDFFACEVALPPLPEQKKIAAILSSVDEAIRATEAVIEQTRRVKEGLLQELLTRGIGHTRFKKTEIGEIPESWEVRPLLRAASLQHGKSFPSSDYTTDGVHLVRPGNLDLDGLVLWGPYHTVCIPERHWDNSPEHRVFGSELLINLTAQSLADNFLGRVGLTPPHTRCLLNQRIGRLTVNPGTSLAFLHWVLQGPQFRSHIRTRGQGSKVQHLYNKDLETALIPIPPEPEQHEIAGRLQSSLTKIRREIAYRDQLTPLKAGLLQDLLTGSVRVSV